MIKRHYKGLTFFKQLDMQILNLNNITILAISDTHSQHRSLHIPVVDIIIHAGDACEDGDEEQLMDFFDWFSELPIQYKIFLAGNHDLIFDLEPERAKEMIPDNVIFLENEGIMIENVQFFGLVARPWMHEVIPIPENIDMLISHGAPQGILDENSGCSILRKMVETKKPKIHLFGHIHSVGCNCINQNSTTFYNVARFPQI